MEFKVGDYVRLTEEMREKFKSFLIADGCGHFTKIANGNYITEITHSGETVWCDGGNLDWWSPRWLELIDRCPVIE